ncbi:hypothetical protein BS618_07660 [Rhodococcus erythropolis]|uniref:hypothetical protein n=1 Tax=Rhodococcus qingshengii TaxID=334542 RepID=UPI000936732B|nr:hypothetical protein [Rhodococcus qingshengii]MCZ4544955.1 hypothetical protein [Rhodococcus qingshengii]OKA15802.1 hypothetical protein BS618_07660 [Rhodococcus erythropolis]
MKPTLREEILASPVTVDEKNILDFFTTLSIILFGRELSIECVQFIVLIMRLGGSRQRVEPQVITPVIQVVDYSAVRTQELAAMYSMRMRS